jgi:hypothetical protein
MRKPLVLSFMILIHVIVSSPVLAQVFGPDVLVDSSGTIYADMEPDIALDDEGNVVVVWCYGDIVNFAKSTDQGQTWHKTVVCGAQSLDYDSDLPALAFDPEGNPWVVWYRWWLESPDYWTVHITHSVDGGITFESSTTIHYENSWSTAQNLTIDENSNVYVPVYKSSQLSCIVIPMGDYEKRYKTLVTPPNLADRGRPDFLAASRDTIFIVFEADSNDWSAPQSIYFTMSTDRGSTFAEPVLVSEEPLIGNYGAFSPTVVVDESSTIYTAWDDDRTGEHLFILPNPLMEVLVFLRKSE